MKPYKKLYYEDSDDWLKQYTLNPIDKYIDEDTQRELLWKYSADRDMILHRGINFESKEEWEKFLINTNNLKKYYILGIDSFSPDKNVALTFARTRPMYMSYMDSEDIRDLKNRNKMKDRYAGYIGIIITIKAQKEKIIDLSKSNYQKERECLLTKGNYIISSYKILKQYRDILSNEKKVEKLLNKFSTNLYLKSGEYRNLIKKIFETNEISNVVKNNFISKIKFTSVNFKHGFDKEYPSDSNGEINYYASEQDVVRITFNGTFMYLIYFLIDMNLNKATQAAQVFIDSFGKELQKYILQNKLNKFSWSRDQQGILNIFDDLNYRFNLNISEINKARGLFNPPVKPSPKPYYL